MAEPREPDDRTGSLAPVDVVILTWNDGDLLESAVRSALESVGVDVRVAVVDNGSEPPAVPPADERVALIRNERNLGVAAARNQGVRAGSAEIVCLLDSDAELLPGSLCTLADALLSGADVALSAPVFVDQAPEASAGRAPTLSRKLQRAFNMRDAYEGTARFQGAQMWDVDFAIGACQVFRRSAFVAVEGLDEQYFYGPEDVDFCLRLREGGWRIVQVADAPVIHPPRRRNRHLLTRRGARHAQAVIRHLWRHRFFERQVRRGHS